MKTATFVLLLFASIVDAQAPSQPVVRVVPEKLTVKTGELYELVATTKGEVKFLFDGVKGKVNGKVLTFIAPHKDAVIRVASQDPFDVFATKVEVERPTPDPDLPDKLTDSIVKLRADMNAGFKRLDTGVATLESALVRQDVRIKALENIKPIPPDPKPPTPNPVIKELRVLIVYESMQGVPILAASVRGYLDAKCVKSGSHPEWRMYDKDTVVTTDGAHWKTLLAQNRNSIPYIYLLDGFNIAYEGALPATATDTLTLLKKYAEGTRSLSTSSGQSIEERIRFWETNFPEYASKP